MIRTEESHLNECPHSAVSPGHQDTQTAGYWTGTITDLELSEKLLRMGDCGAKSAKSRRIRSTY